MTPLLISVPRTKMRKPFVWIVAPGCSVRLLKYLSAVSVRNVAPSTFRSPSEPSPKRPDDARLLAGIDPGGKLIPPNVGVSLVPNPCGSTSGMNAAFPMPSAVSTNLSDACPLVILSFDTASGASFGLVTLPSASAAVPTVPGPGITSGAPAAKMLNAAVVAVTLLPLVVPIARSTQLVDGVLGTVKASRGSTFFMGVTDPNCVNVVPPSVLSSTTTDACRVCRNVTVCGVPATSTSPPCGNANCKSTCAPRQSFALNHTAAASTIVVVNPNRSTRHPLFARD